MDASEKIVRSCELVESAWVQVEDLANSLTAMTESALETDAIANWTSAGQPNTSTGWSESGWSVRAYAVSCPVKEKRRRRATPSAWINYQIDLFGEGLPPVADNQAESVGPVLHVSFWLEATNFPNTHVEFESDWDDWGCWELKEERLIFWNSAKEGDYAQWTFSIRLLDMHSQDALRQSVLEPVIALLTGAEVHDALPDTLPGLVFYIIEGDRNVEWKIAARQKGR